MDKEYNKFVEQWGNEKSRYNAINTVLQVIDNLKVSIKHEDNSCRDLKAYSVASSNDFEFNIKNQFFEFEVKIEEEIESRKSQRRKIHKMSI